MSANEDSHFSNCLAENAGTRMKNPVDKLVAQALRQPGLGICEDPRLFRQLALQGCDIMMQGRDLIVSLS